MACAQRGPQRLHEIRLHVCSIPSNMTHQVFSSSYKRCSMRRVFYHTSQQVRETDKYITVERKKATPKDTHKARPANGRMKILVPIPLTPHNTRKLAVSTRRSRENGQNGYKAQSVTSLRPVQHRWSIASHTQTRNYTVCMSTFSRHHRIKNRIRNRSGFGALKSASALPSLHCNLEAGTA